jgi:peptide/nickel transport system permease protein
MQNPTTLQQRTAPTPAGKAAPEIATAPVSQLRLIWLRFRRHKPAMVGLAILLVMIALAVCAPFITPENPYDQFSYDAANADLSPRLTPAWFFILGTDTNGHTILSQIVWGARISLAVGLVSAFGASFVGVLVGAISGYLGGWIDTVVMRLTDVFLTLPFLPLLLLAADLFGQGHLWIIIAILIIFSWPGIARLTRAAYLSLREQEFAEAARAVGVSEWRIIFRHLLPNALRPVLVATTLAIATFIVVEAAIDFLGAGVTYPDASWGNILANAQTSFGTGNWWWPTFPGLALVLTVLAVNFLGDGLGDALDVRATV